MSIALSFDPKEESEQEVFKSCLLIAYYKIWAVEDFSFLLYKAYPFNIFHLGKIPYVLVKWICYGLPNSFCSEASCNNNFLKALTNTTYFVIQLGIL